MVSSSGFPRPDTRWSDINPQAGWTDVYTMTIMGRKSFFVWISWPRAGRCRSWLSPAEEPQQQEREVMSEASPKSAKMAEPPSQLSSA